MQVSQRSINGSKVLLNDSITFLAISFLNSIFNLGNSFIFRQNVRNCEEASLHDGVNALTHTGFTSNVYGVDGVEVQFFIDDFFLNFNRQLIPDFFFAVRSVQQESSSRFSNFQNINFSHERELVASHKVSLVNEVS